MTVREVAEWMKQAVEDDGWLYQEVVAMTLYDDHGYEFVYENQNGNLAINKEVLKEFRKITEDTVVWERGDKAWRLREEYDPEGRQAD